MYRRFISGHNGRGILSPSWKGGERISNDGYQIVWVGINKIARKHRLIFEEYYKCCLLPWAEVHHINGIKTDNRIENLKGMTKRQHTSLHQTLDMSNRRCSNCGSSKTIWDKRGWFIWFNDGFGGFLCRRCYRRKHYKETGKN